MELFRREDPRRFQTLNNSHLAGGLGLFRIDPPHVLLFVVRQPHRAESSPKRIAAGSHPLLNDPVRRDVDPHERNSFHRDPH